jgi:hypothetical protein
MTSPFHRQVLSRRAFDPAIKRSANVGRTKEQEGSPIETALSGFGSSAIVRILVVERAYVETFRTPTEGEDVIGRSSIL